MADIENEIDAEHLERLRRLPAAALVFMYTQAGHGGRPAAPRPGYEALVEEARRTVRVELGLTRKGRERR
jgi:hypothetical protein